jgi:hypothetical protein
MKGGQVSARVTATCAVASNHLTFSHGPHAHLSPFLELRHPILVNWCSSVVPSSGVPHSKVQNPKSGQDGSLDGLGRPRGRLESAKSLVFTEGWTTGRLKTPGSLPPPAPALALAPAFHLAPLSASPSRTVPQTQPDPPPPIPIKSQPLGRDAFHPRPHCRSPAAL